MGTICMDLQNHEGYLAAVLDDGTVTASWPFPAGRRQVGVVPRCDCYHPTRASSRPESTWQGTTILTDVDACGDWDLFPEADAEWKAHLDEVRAAGEACAQWGCATRVRAGAGYRVRREGGWSYEETLTCREHVGAAISVDAGDVRTFVVEAL